MNKGSFYWTFWWLHNGVILTAMRSVQTTRTHVLIYVHSEVMAHILYLRMYVHTYVYYKYNFCKQLIYIVCVCLICVCVYEQNTSKFRYRCMYVYVCTYECVRLRVGKCIYQFTTRYYVHIQEIIAKGKHLCDQGLATKLHTTTRRIKHIRDLYQAGVTTITASKPTGRKTSERYTHYVFLCINNNKHT